MASEMKKQNIRGAQSVFIKEIEMPEQELEDWWGCAWEVVCWRSEQNVYANWGSSCRWAADIIRGVGGWGHKILLTYKTSWENVVYNMEDLDLCCWAEACSVMNDSKLLVEICKKASCCGLSMPPYWRLDESLVGAGWGLIGALKMSGNGSAFVERCGK